MWVFFLLFFLCFSFRLFPFLRPPPPLYLLFFFLPCSIIRGNSHPVNTGLYSFTVRLLLCTRGGT